MDRQPATFPRQLYLLGGLRVQAAGTPRPLTRGKAQSLLAYLALHPRAAQRREALADLLAPEAEPERARRQLSDTLYRLQKTLGRDWLAVSAETVALRVDAELWVDVWAFERLAASPQPADLQAAVALYAGDLLPEIYADWVLAERELRRNQYLSALEKLAAQQAAAGELQQATLTTRRLIVADPLHEPAHLAYLRLLGRLRRHGEALAHYEDLRQRLWAELNAEPMAETRAVAEALARERSLAAEPAVVEERTVFVGRVSERAAALAAVEAALGGRGGLLAIEGEAGLGKSRLWREIAAGARWRGAAVAQGVASEVPSASPFAPLAEALAALLHGARAAQLEALLTAETRAALAPLYPAWGARAAPAEPPTQQTRQVFYQAVRVLGEKLPRLAPLVLALDDVQWADPALWECLDALAHSLPRAGGLLVLLYRRPEIEQTPGWPRLQAWDRAGALKTLALPPLSVEEVAQLIGRQAPADPAQVQAVSGGNPFLIGEWLAEAAPGQPPHRYAAARRLAGLSLAARAALECAAVAGESLPFSLWAAMTALPPLTLAGLSEELAARHWLDPSPAGFRFAHDLLRTGVYESIEPRRQRALHERAARAYAAGEPDNARARAFHFDRAGLAAEAASAYCQAARQDLARFAFREAQAALERALALMPPAPTVARVEAALALAQTCEITGDRARQRPALEEALAGARHLRHDPLRLQVLLAVGRAASSTDHFADAGASLSEALALAEQSQDPASATEAVLLLGMHATQQGQWRAAHDRYAEALAMARASADPAREARALRGLGITARDRGAPAESVARLEEAAALQHRIGDRLGEALTQTNLVTAYYDLGAWDRLIHTAETVLPRTEALGNRYSSAYLRHLQGLAAHALGDSAAARRLFERARQDFKAVENRRAAGLALNALGLVAEAEGQFEEALALYRAALAEAEALQIEAEAAVAQHDLGALLLRLGRPAEAIPLLEAARAGWTADGNELTRFKSEAVLGLARLAAGQTEAAGEWAQRGLAAFEAGLPPGEQPQGWLWALHQLLAGLGQAGPARAVLRAAYDELQRQAQAIGDPQRRRSFFERVALNRDIVAAYDQLTAPARVIVPALARRAAPLGRTLRPDERVPVRWTVSAPEDEAIAGKGARRQHRLRRLLLEAESQGAAPTDDDLARALGVSRRTVLRDMQTLAGSNNVPPTRRRQR